MATEEVKIINVWVKHYPYRRWYDKTDNVYKTEKAKKSLKAQLADPETKQKTLDFIFGKTAENPITR